MSSAVKTFVATGASSGLGFELVKQLLSQSAQPYRFILGARDTARTQAAYDALGWDKEGGGAARHSLAILPVELSDLKTVGPFARRVREALGPEGRVDELFLNAGASNKASDGGPPGAKWCTAYYINHLSQHYLVHLLRPELEASKARLVFVSSGAIRGVSDPTRTELDTKLAAGSTADENTYGTTKFVALLGAHWWRRQLGGSGCTVVAVSPGLIPSTGIGNGAGFTLSASMPDAKTVPEGARNLLRAFEVSEADFPRDPDQIFLTSWGEWWPTSVFEPSLDRQLQDKWCPSREQIEKDEGLAAA